MLIKKEKWFLCILFFISVFIRTIVFFCYLSKEKKYWQVDSNTYHKIAVNISQGKGISIEDENTNFYRLPGYPIFLAIYYKLFGIDTKNVLWAQIILASFIPILIFFLSITLFPHMLILAKLASCYSAVHFGLVLYSGFFMTESLFLFLFLFFCIFFFCKQQTKGGGGGGGGGGAPPPPPPPFYIEETSAGEGFIHMYENIYGKDIQNQYKLSTSSRNNIAQQRQFQYIFYAGIFLGLASLVRPVGHYLIFVASITLFLSASQWKKKLHGWAAFFCAWLIPTLPWLLRNYFLLGYLFFHTLPGGHFLYLSAARTVMHAHNISYEEARQELRKEVVQEMYKQKEEKHCVLNEIEVCYAHEKIAFKYFKNYPFITLKNWLTDILRTSLSLYSAEIIYIESGKKEIQYFARKHTIWSMFKRYLFPQTNNLLLLLIVYIEIILFLFILLGILFSLWKIWQHPQLLWVFLKTFSFVFLFLFISLAGGYARMRLPAEPFFIILSLRFWLNYTNFQKYLRFFKMKNALL
jgi:4-amino-4-deoxy-L-arabinose transferase-like glycosyltransferase